MEASITVTVTRNHGANFAYREWGHQVVLGQKTGCVGVIVENRIDW